MKELVILDQDGGVPDDFLALLLVLAMQHIHLLGVVVTPGDSIIAPAINITRKLIDLALPIPEYAAQIPVVQSTARPVNPFPWDWRNMAYSLNDIPVLNLQDWDTFNAPLITNVSAGDWMGQTVLGADANVTLLVTGPLTNVAEMLQTYGDQVANKIEKIVWMGGAINVPGNVDTVAYRGQDGSVEWNAFWDPFANEQVWKSSIPIVLCPLDITNDVPVTRSLIQEFIYKRDNPIADFAATAYSIADTPAFYAWDVLATSYVVKPDMFQLKEINTWVSTEGESQGRIYESEEGRVIKMLSQVDLDEFYLLLKESWTIALPIVNVSDASPRQTNPIHQNFL
eukprot:TRINITY_DN2556_c0_g1_i2.p1 TRINITY_DN2556_c0_g1~~TRINITY_DN2556_c0_g1_i2.p1  ORF type:complete len:340 (-),score=84.75 TRINITY_DN2556_c0_g1_i2:52-1071(-)